MRLIVGLGNPGTEYQNTRHNIGFLIIDELVKELGIKPKWSKKFQGLYLKEGNLVFLKPQTYMNLSGDSVVKAAKFFKIHSKDILVIHDDLDLEEGKVRFREQGSSGGHNGLKSIIASLGQQDFPRIKIGIGHPESKEKVTRHVLGKFQAPPETINKALLKTNEWLKNNQNNHPLKKSWKDKFLRR